MDVCQDHNKHKIESKLKLIRIVCLKMLNFEKRRTFNIGKRLLKIEVA